MLIYLLLECCIDLLSLFLEFWRFHNSFVVKPVASLVEFIDFLIEASLLSDEGESVFGWIVATTNSISQPIAWQFRTCLPEVWRQNFVRKLLIMLRKFIKGSLFSKVVESIRLSIRWEWSYPEHTPTVYMAERC